MQRSEILERLAALTGGLEPARGVFRGELSDARELLVRDLAASQTYGRAPETAGIRVAARLPARLDPASLGPELARELERVVDLGMTPDGSGATPSESLGTRISRRTLPILSSVEAESIPPWAAGRRIERTLGPFIDRDGRPVWFDVFQRVRQVSLVRGPGTSAILRLPLKGFLIGSATEYTIPAGSVWIESRLLAASAPVGGYSGMRIQGGKLRLSAAPSVSGTTLTIGTAVKVTLELTLDPPASSATATTPGRDARNAVAQVPDRVIFAMNAAGTTLEEAGDARVDLFGSGFDLERAAAPARYEPLLNRVLLPFAYEPGELAVESSESDLFQVSKRANVAEAAWALPVAVTPPQDLGEASGAGGLALALEKGLEATWRGLDARPVAINAALALVETDRLSLLAGEAIAAGARQTLRLWNADGGAGSAVTLGFDRARLRYESVAGKLDAVLASAALEAAADRPIAADGNRFALRSKNALVLFWRDGTAFQVIAQAALEPPDPSRVTAVALTNALITVSPPAALVLTGHLPDPGAVLPGALALEFSVRNFLLTLADPYVTTQPLPGRSARAVEAAGGPALISLVRWQQVDAPQLALSLLPTPAGAGSFSALSIGSTASGPDPVAADAAPKFYLLAHGENAPSPAETRQEDLAAEAGLRDLFERAAGRVRESIALLDVSTNVDQFGVGWGYGSREALAGTNASAGGFPLQIDGIDVVTPGRNARLFLLPQFQWEPVRNVPNPNIGPFPDRLVSADDGGATLFGSNSVRLVPIAPGRVMANLVDEFNGAEREQVGALFTLPFGIKAAAQLRPQAGDEPKWAGLESNRPATADSSFVGGLQLSVTAHSATGGPTEESPSLPGAAWQTRNGVDPSSGAANGFSVLRGDVSNEGVEEFFNGELGPGGTNPRVPVVRVDFAGYGASTFSQWFNPNAVAEISQVRFDVFVGRTAYEVVQVASILYPWAVPVVRTITFERRKEALVFRADSGWVATGPGLYRYPPVNPTATPPASWSPIESHPGVVRGAYDVRRIRETGRVVEYTGTDKVELLEVRFDADFEIEDVIRGQIAGTKRVPSIDQVGFVQRMPKGYTVTPEDLATILADEGPWGGPVDCDIDIADSGQRMRVVRVDVDASRPIAGGTPELAAAARGSLALPEDGAWSLARRRAASDDLEPVDLVAGTPLIRQGLASAPASASAQYRISDPIDVLRETDPELEFGLLQSSDGHQILFPRPRILAGSKAISSSERALLADAYARAISAGLFPKRSSCFVAQAASELGLTAQGRYKLSPTTLGFDNVPGGGRSIIDAEALGLHTRYSGPIRYTLDPTQATPWRVDIDSILTSLDLGPFDDLMGVKHSFRAAAGEVTRLIDPEQVYAPFLDPVVAILRFLSKLLGTDEIFEVVATQGSFKFQATARIPIEGPGNSYVDLVGLKFKGKVEAGFGWNDADHWFGFLGVDLGMKVLVLPAVYADGKASVALRGTEVGGRLITFRMLWGLAIEATLGPIGVSAEFDYGVEVVVAEAGSWQIGLLVRISGEADVFIASVSVMLEFMAAIARDASGTVEAVGQAKFAVEVEICWFVTIDLEYDIEFRKELAI